MKTKVNFLQKMSTNILALLILIGIFSINLCVNTDAADR